MKLLLPLLFSLAISISGCMPNNSSPDVPANTQPQQSTEQVTTGEISPSGKTMLIDAGNQ
jgi:hypothetical protein